MLGLDDRIAAFAHGSSLWIVVVVAILLGLRHATDPDHLAAVTTLVASTRDRAARRAGRLGLAWGLGHAISLTAFGLPLLLLHSVLPERVEQGAETVIGLVIVYLAVRLLLRWRRGGLHFHPHPDAHRARTQVGAFGIGLVHGMGGSAGVGVLLLASIQSRALAVASLLLFAACTAISMTILSTGFGSILVARPVRHTFALVAPALGTLSLVFGIWYGVAAWNAAPYPF
jgi:cytochrome c biogenesis protein CcdA